jgi:Glyoxalase-like domain
MTSRISHTTVDAHNAYEQSVWWCRVLGFGEDPQDPNRPGDEECMIFSPDGRIRVLFIEVRDDKVVKNRIHFDLSPTDRTRDEEVERLLGLGATEFADHRNPDCSGWVTMADPEGNEFCVLRSDVAAGSVCPLGHLTRSRPSGDGRAPRSTPAHRRADRARDRTTSQNTEPRPTTTRTVRQACTRRGS